MIAKGFRHVKNQSKRDDHDYYYLYVDGKRQPRAWTKISRSSTIEYGDSLIALVKRQLQLETNAQVRALVECELGEHDYVRMLRDKGVIST